VDVIELESAVDARTPLALRGLDSAEIRPADAAP